MFGPGFDSLRLHQVNTVRTADELLLLAGGAHCVGAGRGRF